LVVVRSDSEAHQDSIPVEAAVCVFAAQRGLSTQLPGALLDEPAAPPNASDTRVVARPGVRLAYINRSPLIGNNLMRRPVAWCLALAMAADTPPTPISTGPLIPTGASSIVNPLPMAEPRI
jgi:hypothetical protein